MNVNDLEINELGPVSGKKKQIIIGIFAVAILIGILFLFLSFFKPGPLNAYFTDPTVRPGAKTILVVEFKNVENADLHNVLFKVTPEVSNINISESQHTEEVIGSGAYRRLEIPVTVNGSLTQGTYKIRIEVDAGKEKWYKDVYLEITK